MLAIIDINISLWFSSSLIFGLCRDGTQGVYFKLPPLVSEGEKSPVYLCFLDTDMQDLSELYRKAHLQVIAMRHSPVAEATQNVYMSDDRVDASPAKPRQAPAGEIESVLHWTSLGAMSLWKHG